MLKRVIISGIVFVLASFLLNSKIGAQEESFATNSALLEILSSPSTSPSPTEDLLSNPSTELENSNIPSPEQELNQDISSTMPSENDNANNGEEQVREKVPDKELVLIDPKSEFAVDEHPNFTVVRKLPTYKKVANYLQLTLTNKSLSDINHDVELMVTDSRGQLNEDFEIVFSDQTTFTVQPKTETDVKPGTYQMSIITPEEKIDFEFSWGVLAMNTDKSIYTPNEVAQLAFAVLNNVGEMVCDADVVLSINKPDGAIDQLTTSDGTIQLNPDCNIFGPTENPDYAARYQFGELGQYDLKLEATTANGTHQISESIQVVESVPFSIKRIGPTRIYPPVTNSMEIIVEVNEAFSGTVVETVPSSFQISGIQELQQIQEADLVTILDAGNTVPGKLVQSEQTQTIHWQANWQPGEVYQLKYQFNTPFTSPDFYTLGPLKLGDASIGEGGQVAFNHVNFSEYRAWQLAIDAYDDVVLNTNGGPDYRLKLNGNLTESIAGLSVSGAPASYVTTIIPNDTGQSGEYTGSQETVFPNTTGVNSGTTYRKIVSFWVEIDTFGTGTGNNARNIWEEGGGTNWWGAYTANGDSLYISIGESNSQRGYCFESGLSTGTLYHVVMQWEASTETMELWINGEQACSTTTTTSGGLANHTGDWEIGGDSDARDHTSTSIGNLRFDGKIADYAYWAEPTRLLTSQEIGDIYTAGAGIQGTAQLHYQWRDDTTALNTAGGTLAAEDTVMSSNITKNQTYRLRMEVANTDDTAESSARTYELQYGDRSGYSNCSEITTWTGVADANDAFDMADSTLITNGQSTTGGLLSNSESYTFVNGVGHDTTDTTGSIGPLDPAEYTELEYSIKATDDSVTGRTYCFRLYDTTADAPLDAYALYPRATISYEAAAAATTMEWGTQSNVSKSSWSTINFSGNYTDPVFLCTVNYNNNIGNESDGNADSVVCRVQNLDADSAEVRLQEPGDLGGVSQNETIHWLVAEAGTYDNDDITMEAFNFTSTVTDDNDSYVGQTQTYSQSYTDPVVLSQVSSYNDTGWSVAYCKGSSDSDPPSSSTLICGKHVGEDTDITRNNETISVMVIEQTSGTLDTNEFEAWANTGKYIDRIDDSTTDSYTFNSSFTAAPQVALLGQAGIGGADGPHPVLYGANPLTSSAIYIQIMEDEIAASEQSGNAEDVHYLAIESAGSYSASEVAIDQTTYRFYENTDAIQPTTALAAENTAPVDIASSDVIRLRTSLQIGRNDLTASTQSFTLQYGEGSNCSAISNWYDVGTAGSGTIWRGYDNGTPADGATITSSLLNSQANTYASYEESNDSVTNPNQINKGSRGEWDWVIQNNGATASTDYCFRMVTSADSVLQYTHYPQLTTAAAGGFTVSGVFYQGDESTPDPGQCNGSTENLTLRVNGSNPVTTSCASTTGVFSFSGINASAGDTITIYSTGTDLANTVYVSDGDADASIPLYENTVIVRDDQDGTVTNADLSDYDNDDDATNLLFTANSNNISVESDYELHVHTGDTYDPGGTVTTAGSGDLHVDDSATAYLDTASNTISGDIVVDTGATMYIDATTAVTGGAITTAGTGVVDYSTGTPTVTIDGTGSIGGGSGAITFYGLTLGSTGTDTTTLASDVFIEYILTINSAQTFAATTQNVTVGSASVSNSGDISNSGTYSQTGGTTRIQGYDGDISINFGGTGSTTFYNLELGPSSPDEASYSFRPTGTSITVSNNMILQDADDSGGDDTHSFYGDTNDTAITVGGSLTIDDANSFRASDNTANPLTIGDDFTNNGTFMHRNGRVVFNNNANTSTLLYSATTTFYELYVATGGKPMEFDNVDATNIAAGGTFSIQGTDCTTGLISLNSDTGAAQFELNIDAAATVDIDYADIQYSNATGQAIDATEANNSVDSGNNTNWTIGTGACGGIDVTGTVYSNEGSTPLTSVDVCGVVNSGTPSCDTSDGSGVFEITGMAASAGDQLTFFIDGGTYLGNTVTISDGNDITSGDNLHIYQYRVIPRYEQGSSISIADMDAYDNDQNPTDMLFDAEDSTIDTLSIESLSELHISTGNTFDANGVITTAGVTSIHLDDNATAYLDEDGNSIGGNFVLDNSASIYIDGSTTVGRDITMSNSSLLQINADLTINGGDIFMGGLTQTISTTAGTPTLTMSGTGSIGGSTSPSITIYNFATTGSGTTTLTEDATVLNDVTVGTGTTLTIGANLDINGGDLTTVGTGIINYSGTPTVDISGTGNIGGGSGAITLYDLTTSGTGTTTLASAATVAHNLTVAANTSLDLNAALTVTGTLSISGTMNQTTANVTAGTTSIASGGEWSNLSTGDIEIGTGGVTNAGTMTLKSNDGCGGTDEIVVTATSGTPNWSGAGTYDLQDVALSNQNATVAISVYSGTNGSPTNHEFTIQDDGDDGYTYSTNWLPQGYENENWIGNYTYDDNPGLRFTGVTISQNANITAAEIQVYANQSFGSSWTSTIYGSDDVLTFTSTFPGQFSNTDRPDGMTKTTAYVDWPVSSWPANQYVSTPDITSIVQELVDRSDWDSGDVMRFGIVNGSTHGNEISFEDYSKSGSQNLAKLLITTNEGENTGNWTFYANCTAGDLVTDIVDAAGSPVANPSINMGNEAFAFTFQTAEGTFGTASEKMRVSNTTANELWTLSIAASGGSAAVWDSAGTDYDYNDPTAAAGDGSDGDSLGGQMTINASAGTLTPEAGCSNTGITMGSSNSFNEETALNSITLLTTGGTAETNCYWDLTGVDIDQTIPAEQPAASDYSIDMTISIVAN